MNMPQDRWAWLRQHHPIFHDESSGVFVLSTYRDVTAALRSRNTSAADAQQQRQDAQGVLPSLLTSDGEDHRRLRQNSAFLVSDSRLQGFSRHWRDNALGLARALSHCDQPLNLASRLAEPWATEVICDLLDVSDPTSRATLGELLPPTRVCLDPRPPAALAARARQVNEALGSWLRFYVESTNSQLIESLRDGLEQQEIVTLLALCAVGGWSPLADAAACAVLLAADHPSGSTDESRSRFIEESLRWQSPVPHVARSCTAELQLASGAAGPGLLVASLASANRDESTYPDAERFDPDRGGPAPVAFGLGPHYCLGAPVVRAALRALLEATADPTWPTLRACAPLLLTETFPRRLTDPSATVAVP